MGGRDHSIECQTCGESYGGMNAQSEEHECDPASAEQLRLMRFSTLDYHSESCDCESCTEEYGAIQLERTLSNLAACLREAAVLDWSWKLGGLFAARIGNTVLLKWKPNTRGDVAPGWTVK